MAQDVTRVITLKPPARKSGRKKTNLDYADLENGAHSSDHWMRIMQDKPIKDDIFKRMKGSDVSHEWLEQDEDAMKEPIVIVNPEGLGMKMPPKSFSVDDVANTVGRDHPVQVMGSYISFLTSFRPLNNLPLTPRCLEPK